MKRNRLLILAALAILLATLWGGRKNVPATVSLNGQETPVVLTEDEHVWLTVDPSTVTATGAMAVLHKEGIPKIGYGEQYWRDPVPSFFTVSVPCGLLTGPSLSS